MKTFNYQNKQSKNFIALKANNTIMAYATETSAKFHFFFKCFLFVVRPAILLYSKESKSPTENMFHDTTACRLGISVNY